MTMTSSTGILPSYQRFVNGVPVPLFARRAFRPREKYLILLVFLTFGVVCFGAFFFLPDFRAGTGGAAVNSVYRVYQRMQKAGPELLIPAPPRAPSGLKDPNGHPNAVPFGHEDGDHQDVHLVEDKQKLQAKIDEEYQQQKTLEKPEVIGDTRVRTSSSSSMMVANREKEESFETVPPAPAERLPLTVGGEDRDPVARERRNKVKELPINFESPETVLDEIERSTPRHEVKSDESRPFLKAAPEIPSSAHHGARITKDNSSATTSATTATPDGGDVWWRCSKCNLDEMRLMQRLAISGLLSVILIVLLAGTFVTRRDLASVVDRGVAPEERVEQPVNPAWVQDNVVPGQDEQPKADMKYPRARLDFRHRQQSEPSAVGPPPAPVPGPYVIKPPNPPLDDVTNQRREKVKEMMKHGWDNYVRYAWGKNELKPISKKGHSASIFGTSTMGATIVDGLDTLYIMGLHDEFKQGRDWIAENLNFDINSEISLFETNIRFMGSLLACYALTGDVMFRDKAAQLGERMLPAFQTKTGIPHSLINLHTGASKNYGWASSGCSILSEIGTMHLEFTYLSDITGNPVFKTKVENVRSVLKSLEKPKGLYPNYIHPATGKWGQHHMSLGGLGDSFYEYLLKAWIQSGKEDTEARKMYDDAIAAITLNMIKTSPGKLVYVSDLKYDRPEHKMGHLACFAGGMFALGAMTQKDELSNKYMDIAAGLTNTCHESYDRSATKLGPEAFHFIEGNEARSLKSGEKYYILRPETFESYFVMWRLTKNPKYREWGWEAVQALEKHCRVPGGFTGLHNVYLPESPKDDVQQSYFFAETLKYLYLLFSDDDLINLDDWVFNSEAHVLPIKGNPLYRPAPPL